MEEEASDETGTTSGLYLRLETSVLEGACGGEGAGSIKSISSGNLVDNEMGSVLVVHETFSCERCQVARKRLNEPRE
jgi:hypothetical protein